MTRILRIFLLPAIVAGAALASPARAQMSESELVMRLNRLENQVRQLTGQVEQLTYRNSQLEQQLARAPQGGPPPAQQRGSIMPPVQTVGPQVHPLQQAFPPPQEAYPPGSPPAGG